MAKSRVKNTVRNSVVGIVTYGLTSIISFVCRTLFIQILGVEYLGIGSLYSNILSVLAISDMGIGTVMIYSLYKPLAENDQERIKALVRYYRKLYYCIAAIILALGVALIPVLPYIVSNTSLSVYDLRKYYMLILLNSVSSYFAVSRSMLITADQHMSTVQIVHCISTVTMHILQIVIILMTKNYTFYLVVPIIMTLSNNLVVSWIANKRYPYLKEKTDYIIDESFRKSIFANLKSTFVYRLGATIINSTDNIIISVLLGAVTVGFYGNYYLIVSMVNTVIAVVVQSVIASIGNFNVSQNETQKYELYRQTTYIFYFIAAFCAACYLCVFDGFITLWIGKEYVLDQVFLICLVFNNFVFCIYNPVWMMRESAGEFKPVRYVMLIAAAVNIAASLLLGSIMGLAGIILATAVARLSVLFWYEPIILCKKVFRISLKTYWKKIIRPFIACIPPFLLGIGLQHLYTHNIMLLLVKVIVCFFGTLLSFVLITGNTFEFQTLKSRASKIIKRRKAN